jgi:hypothetical protein
VSLSPAEEAALAELEFNLSAPHTLQAIAKQLGMPFQQVAAIEKRALKKLREIINPDWQGPLTDDDRVGYIEPESGVILRSGNSQKRGTAKLQR